ncbi:MAG: PIN domain-containing protein [Devosia sp.]
MPGGRFFDSNVLIYSISGDDAKTAAAREHLAGRGAISVQVLNEVANVARNKMAMTWLEIRETISVFQAGLIVHPLSVRTHNLGLTLAERHGLHIYDAMIVAAALEADCDTLYSEDMHAGLVVDGRLTIVNPFA